MTSRQTKHNVILIGAGVMSATLGSMLREVAPHWDITVFEKLKSPGEESSNEWNNAGTGHAALCELNYTNERPDGTVDADKAVKINEQFQVSLQFWSYLVNKGLMENPRDFIVPLPHMSFVQGAANVDFLKKRLEALSQTALFEGMEFSDDPEQLEKWIPLMMKGRTVSEPIAATKMEVGTDVNFGALTRKLFSHLESTDVTVNYRHSVENLTQREDGSWELKIQNDEQDRLETHTADFVFVGGGGGSLHLLQKSGIPEGKGVGGFPVSGMFLVCDKPDVVEQHYGKVYGKAPVGAPPMSVPHLDTRFMEGKETLFFGPFAGFSPKFLKTGSHLDLITSVRADNLLTMSAAGLKNIPLTKYLIGQVMLSKEQRMEALREFVPTAKSDDWRVVVSGQRVQVIKDTDKGKGTLQFGTEVINAADGSIAALLGASPGASTAVSVMLDVMERCFPDHIEEWTPKLKEMIPSYGLKLSEHPEMIRDIHESTEKTLQLRLKKEAKMS